MQGGVRSIVYKQLFPISYSFPVRRKLPFQRQKKNQYFFMWLLSGSRGVGLGGSWRCGSVSSKSFEHSYHKLRTTRCTLKRSPFLPPHVKYREQNPWCNSATTAWKDKRCVWRLFNQNKSADQCDGQTDGRTDRRRGRNHYFGMKARQDIIPRGV